ncbi:MAG: 2-oxoacid:acceptor oxidoreductase family protein [Vulcanimicrobiota bacterium]
MERCEIILSGIGGQGLLLAGLILGDAAAIGEGKYAAQIESYAPLARGGSSQSELIISTSEIDYPKVRKANVLVALAQEAYLEQIGRVREDGLVIADAPAVKPAGKIKTIEIPLTEIARETTGKTFTVSIVALGILARLTEVVSLSSLLNAVNFRAPMGTEEINRKAASGGYEAAEKYLSLLSGKSKKS